MIDEKTPKERMFCKWQRFASTEEILDALLDKDPTKLDAIIAMKERVAAYNAKMASDIDAADPAELERMIKTYTPYQDV